MKGEIWDYEVLPDGSRRLIGHGENLVVNTAYIAIAMAMKLDPANGGFMYWALGDGDGSNTADWDAGVVDGSKAPTLGDTVLANEIFRKAIVAGDIDFIDGAGNVSGTPTNRLEIRITFANNEPSGVSDTDLREWGIFGGDATGTADSGYMINRKVHKTFTKTTVASLERVLRFTF